MEGNSTARHTSTQLLMHGVATLVLLAPPTTAASELFEGQRYYFGDLHAHSGASGDGYSSDIGQDCYEADGERQPCGAVEDVVQTARDLGLDFLAMTDHVNGEQRSEPETFERVLEIAMAGHAEDEGFLTIPAGEIWVAPNGKLGGHLNLYFFAENSELFDLHYEDLVFGYIDGHPSVSPRSCGALWRWMGDLEGLFGPVLLLPHHPQMAEGMATNWACHSRVYPQARHYAPAVEIYSRHGNSTVLPAFYDPLWKADTEQLHDLDAALDPERWGLRLGLLAGTDTHDTLPGSVCTNSSAYLHMPYGGGLAVAVLPETEPWSRASLHQAIMERRTYATSGPTLPVVLDYLVDGERIGGMGEELEVATGAELEVLLRLPSEHQSAVLQATLRTPDDELELTRLADGVYTTVIAPQDRPAWAYAVLNIDGDAWYGQAGCDDGGVNSEERLWLSPTWFDAPAAIDSGDGSPDPDPEPDTCSGCSTTTAPPWLAWTVACLLCMGRRRGALLSGVGRLVRRSWRVAQAEIPDRFTTQVHDP